VNVSALSSVIPTALQEETSSEASQILFGRLMLPDQSEHPFQISQISTDGATILTQAEVPNGVTIVAYIDEIGRVEAKVIAKFDGGIALEFIANETRRTRFEQKLKWISENDKDSANQRRHERFEPKENDSHITMPDGRMYKAEVIDISVGGAAIKIDIMPNLGTYVMLGKMRGRVVRYIEDGIAIEFVRPLSPQTMKSKIA